MTAPGPLGSPGSPANPGNLVPPTSARRIVVLSDTHLATPGRGAGSAEALRPLWQGAAELIINGDIAEINDAKVRGPAARQVLRLQELCEADGVKLTLISGNHDPLITDRRYLRLAQREVFLTHGDILHPAISPWTDHAKHLRTLHADAVLSLNRELARSIDHQLAAAQHASALHWDHAATQPRHPPGTPGSPGSPGSPVRHGKLAKKYALGVKAAKALYYWHTIPRRAMGFARRFAPESRFFIFGHIHRAGIWHDTPGSWGGGTAGLPPGGRFIINTGAYQSPRCPRAVVIDRNTLEVWPVVYDATGHRYGAKPLRAFTLNHAAMAARVEGWDDAAGIHAA